MALFGDVVGYRHLILALACMLSFGSYYAFDMPSVLQSPFSSLIIRKWSDDTETYFNMMYTVYSWSNACFVVFSGIIVDRIGLRMSCYLFLSLCFLGQTIIAFSTQAAERFNLPLETAFFAMMVGRAIFGCGNGAVSVVQNAFCKKWFSGRDLSLAMGVALAFSRFGSWLNFRLTPWLFDSLCSKVCGSSFVYNITAVPHPLAPPTPPAPAPKSIPAPPTHPVVPLKNSDASEISEDQISVLRFGNDSSVMFDMSSLPLPVSAVPIPLHLPTPVLAPAPPGTTAFGMCDWITNTSRIILPADCITPLTDVFWVADALILISFVSCVLISIADRVGDRKYQTADVAAMFAARRFSLPAVITLLKVPSFWLVCIGIALMYAILFPFQADAPKYLAQTYSTPDHPVTSTDGSHAVGWVAFTSMVTSALIGFTTDVVGLRAIFGLGAASVFVFVFGMFTFAPGELPMVVSMLILGVGYVLLAGSLWPALQLVVPSNTIGTANGFAGCAQMVVIGIMNIVSGVLADKSKRDHAHLEESMRPPPFQAVMPVFFGLAVASWFVTLILFFVDLNGRAVLVNGLYCKWSKRALELEEEEKAAAEEAAAARAAERGLLGVDDSLIDERQPLVKGGRVN